MNNKPLSPYGVYLMARLCRLTNKPLSMRRIEPTSEHMFAAVLGTEDGARALLNPNSLIPAEFAFMSAMRLALQALAPHAAAHAARAMRDKQSSGSQMIDDILNESKPAS